MLGLISELIRHSVRLIGTFQLICFWLAKVCPGGAKPGAVAFCSDERAAAF